jgi:hypothetical protein
MLIPLPDEEIDALIREPKTTPRTLFPLRLIEHNKHRRRDYPVKSASGNEFVIAIRQSVFDGLNFSVILSHRRPGFNTLFRLRRYNGMHGEHTNEIEGNKLDDFHVHTATERYQKLGAKEESFAEVTSRHWNLDSAVRCLLEDCGFDSPPPTSQIPISFPNNPGPTP